MHHPINMQTAFNFFLIIVTVFVSGYYLVRGRKLDRWMMAINLLASLLVSAAYGLVYYDALLVDFMTMHEVSIYLLKPVNMILICVMLANIIRIGQKHDR